MADIDIKPKIDIDPNFDIDQNFDIDPNFDSNLVDSAMNIGKKIVTKQGAGQRFIDVQPELKEHLENSPEIPLENIVRGIAGTGVQSVVDKNTGEFKPITKYEVGDTTNRSVHNPLLFEDYEKSSLEGSGNLSYNVPGTHKIIMDSSHKWEPSQNVIDDENLQEALRDTGTSAGGMSVEAVKSRGFVSPEEALDRFREENPIPDKPSETSHEEAGLPHNHLINVAFTKAYDTFIEEGLTPESALNSAKRLIHEAGKYLKDFLKNYQGKRYTKKDNTYIEDTKGRYTKVNGEYVENADHRSLEKEYGISDKASDIRHGLLDVVADDKSTAIPKEVRDLAKQYIAELGGEKYNPDYLPGIGSNSAANLITARSTLWNDFMSAVNKYKKGKGDIETVNEILNQAAYKIHHSATENAIGEVIQQAAQYKNNKTEHNPYSDLTEGDASGKTVQSVMDSIKGVAKPDYDKQSIDGGTLPLTFNSTDSAVFLPVAKRRLASIVREAANTAAMLFDTMRESLGDTKMKELQEAVRYVIGFLNAKWVDAPLTDKKLEIKTKQPVLHDILHNVMTGNQSTAMIGNILYDRNVRLGLKDAEKEAITDIYTDKKFQDASAEEKNKKLKDILMPAVSTEENKNILKGIAERNQLEYSPVSEEHIEDRINDWANVKLWHPDMENDIEYLMKPIGTQLTEDGLIDQDSSVINHMQLRDYDNEMDELRALIIAKGMEKYAPEGLKEDLHAFFTRGAEPLANTVARLVNSVQPEVITAAHNDPNIEVNDDFIDLVKDVYRNKLKDEILNDTGLMNDLKELDRITKRAEPATKSTTKLGIAGNPQDATNDMMEAVHGNVDIHNMGYQYECGDIVSYILQGKADEKFIKRSDGYVYTSEEKFFEALEKIDSMLNDKIGIWERVMSGILMHSEWARVNRVLSAESYSIITYGGINTGKRAADITNATITPDLRVPDTVLEFMGLHPDTYNTGYKGRTTMTMPLQSQDEDTEIRYFPLQSNANPKAMGIRRSALNQALIGSTNVHNTDTGGWHATITGNGNLLAPITDKRFALNAFGRKLLRSVIDSGRLANINIRRIPYALFTKSGGRYDLHNLSHVAVGDMYPLKDTEVLKPSIIDATYRDENGVEYRPRIEDFLETPGSTKKLVEEDDKSGLNAYYKPVKETGKGLFAVNDNGFDFEQEKNDLIENSERNKLHSDYKNSLKALFAEGIKRRFPQVKDVEALKSAATFVDRLFELEQNDLKSIHDYNTKNGIPFDYGEQMEKVYKEFVNNTNDPQMAQIAKEVLPKVLQVLKIPSNEFLHKYGFTHGTAAGRKNILHDLVSVMHDKGITQYMDEMFDKGATLYQSNDARVPGVRAQVVCGEHLKSHQVGLGYHIAKLVFAVPLKQYINNLRKSGRLGQIEKFSQYLKEEGNEKLAALYADNQVREEAFKLQQVQKFKDAGEEDKAEQFIDELGKLSDADKLKRFIDFLNFSGNDDLAEQCNHFLSNSEDEQLANQLEIASKQDSPYYEPLMELLQKMGKELGVSSWRNPKLMTNGPQIFEAIIYPPHTSDGKYLDNRTWTEHIALPHEVYHSWGADNDGDMVAVVAVARKYKWSDFDPIDRGKYKDGIPLAKSAPVSMKDQKAAGWNDGDLIPSYTNVSSLATIAHKAIEENPNFVSDEIKGLIDRNTNHWGNAETSAEPELGAAPNGKYFLSRNSGITLKHTIAHLKAKKTMFDKQIDEALTEMRGEGTRKVPRFASVLPNGNVVFKAKDPKGAAASITPSGRGHNVLRNYSMKIVFDVTKGNKVDDNDLKRIGLNREHFDHILDIVHADANASVQDLDNVLQQEGLGDLRQYTTVGKDAIAPRRDGILKEHLDSYIIDELRDRLNSCADSKYRDLIKRDATDEERKELEREEKAQGNMLPRPYSGLARDHDVTPIQWSTTYIDKATGKEMRKTKPVTNILEEANFNERLLKRIAKTIINITRRGKTNSVTLRPSEDARVNAAIGLMLSNNGIGVTFAMGEPAIPVKVLGLISKRSEAKEDLFQNARKEWEKVAYPGEAEHEKDLKKNAALYSVGKNPARTWRRVELDDERAGVGNLNSGTWGSGSQHILEHILGGIKLSVGGKLSKWAKNLPKSVVYGNYNT